MENKSIESEYPKDNENYDNLEDVRSSFSFRKSAREKTINQLSTIFSKNKSDSIDYADLSNKSYDSLLLNTCQHIGKKSLLILLLDLAMPQKIGVH